MPDADWRSFKKGNVMRNLDITELGQVSGGANQPASFPFPPGQEPSLRNPAHAPGNSYKGPAENNFPKR